MSGYWIDSPDNPFNQMSYTRGGGGYDNSSTHESNAARDFAMQGSGTGALPRYADTQTAQSVLPAGSLAVVGDYVIKTTAQTPAQVGSGAGAGTAATGGAHTSGAGAEAVVNDPQAKTKGAGSRLTITAGAPLKVKTKPENTGIHVGGLDWQPNPWWSDTEEWEARYGEPGDWAGGLVVFGADVVWNAARLADAVITPTNPSPKREAQPMHNNGWVSYDEGASWEFFAKDGTEPFMWDTGGRNPSLSPWQ